MLNLVQAFCPLIFKQVQQVDLVVVHLRVAVLVVLAVQVKVIMVVKLPTVAVVYIVVVVVVAPELLELVILLANLEQAVPDYHQVSLVLRQLTPVEVAALVILALLQAVPEVEAQAVKTVVPQGSQELRIWVAEEAAVLIRAALVVTVDQV
jgi:hypothetical protein